MDTMTLIRRRPTAAEIADAARAEDERRRLDAQFAREQATADRAARRQLERERERADRKRRKAKAKARARRRRKLAAFAGAARTVGPLLLVNAAAVGGQLAYAFSETDPQWPAPVRVAIAVGVATAAESIALYVGWHAHDALLAKAYGTAARLRRASYGIALVVAGVNYSHFADGLLKPTALAVILGVLSSLSPWLWGLHTRRAQHVQLVREDLVDETGAVFDPARRRAFPIRSWLARRWSIDNNVRDPKVAWAGYKSWVEARRAAYPGGRLRAAWSALRGRPLAGSSGQSGARSGHRVRRVPAAARYGARRAVAAPRPRRAMVHVPVDRPAPPPASEADRTAAAYDAYVAKHGRPPSDRRLAELAGVGKTYANEWKRARAAAAQTQ